MGLFGLGSRPKDDWSVMSSIVRAESTLRSRREVTPSRRAGILYRPEDIPFLNDLEKELRPILNDGPEATKTAYRIEDDEHETRWVILEDGNFSDLVSSTYTVGNAMAVNGAGQQRVAAVFEFYRGGAPDSEGDWSSGSPGYWIYRYDRQRFYPFVPEEGTDRNRPAEVEISQIMRRAGISVDKQLEEWRPIGGIPF